MFHESSPTNVSRWHSYRNTAGTSYCPNGSSNISSQLTERHFPRKRAKLARVEKEHTSRSARQFEFSQMPRRRPSFHDKRLSSLEVRRSPRPRNSELRRT